MASTRIKGKGLILTIDGTDYACDLTSCVLNNEESETESDVLTFCEVAGGGNREFKFDITAIQSTDQDSFWTYLWDNSGTTDVDYKFVPHNNDVPTADQPHFTGTLDLPEKPALGGESNSTWTFDITLPVNEVPTKVIA